MLILFIYFCFVKETHSDKVATQTVNIEAIEDEVTIECKNSISLPFEQTSMDDPDIFSKIDPSLPLYFVLHGWTESVDEPYIQLTANELLTRIECSTCIVDYRNLVKYDIARSEMNAVPIGAYLATFIKYLETKGVPTNRVNLVSHSLGAKVASETGERLNGKLGAIYACDPAAPGLKPKYALYTQCIFTAFGFFRPEVGTCHANFYMNGGFQQPMCKNATDFYCSHQASHEYFRFSLNPANKFYGKSCAISILGLFCLFEQRDMIGIYTQKKRGKFDCKTTSTEPYAMN